MLSRRSELEVIIVPDQGHGSSLQRNDAGVWLCEYPGLSFQRCPVRACSLVSSLLLNGATMSQESSLTQSAHSVRQVLTAYTAAGRAAAPAAGSRIATPCLPRPRHRDCEPA